MNLQTELYLAYIEYKAKHQRAVKKIGDELGHKCVAGDVLCLSYLLWVEVSSVARLIKIEHAERELAAKHVDAVNYIKGLYGFAIKYPCGFIRITEI